MARKEDGATFHYSDAVRRVCEEMAFRLPVFAHIRMDQVGISFVRTRNRELFGIYASMTPLRFENGSFQTTRKGVVYEIPEVRGPFKKPILYILSIYAPRFIDLCVTAKIDTLIHELYHIGPNFDGDLRRFGERFYAHGASKKEYDRRVARLSREWLGTDPPPEIWGFLRYDFKELRVRYGKIVGTKIPIPTLRRVER